ncbi:MAG: tetratricopeptide repeat protein [Planctomycetales bacterium]|nr:tetratricopeptide repeat protein [Planctomycetales bacterium]
MALQFSSIRAGTILENLGFAGLRSGRQVRYQRLLNPWSRAPFPRNPRIDHFQNTPAYNQIMTNLLLRRFRPLVALLVACAVASPQSPADEPSEPSSLATKLTRLRAAKDSQPDANAPARNSTYDRMLKSVGLIEITTDDGVVHGTGWVVDRQQRLMVTNHHVIEGWLDCDVYFPEYDDGKLVTDPDVSLDQSRAHYARVVDSDESVDLALIQFDEELPEGIIALELADSSATPGSRIHSLAGSTVGSQSLWIYSVGHVRQIVDGELANGFETRLLESDMATNQGNSGGPVCNDAGQVVAVVEGHCTDARLVSIYVDLQTLAEYLSDGLRCVNAESYDDLHWAADRHYYEGRSRKALELIAKAVEASEIDHELLTLRGWCWFSLEDNENAEADFKESIRLHSTYGEAHYGLGCIAEEQKDYEKAVSHFTDAIRNEPDVVHYLVDRGSARRKLGQFELAKKDIESALRIDSEDIDATCELVFVESDLENFDRALELLDTVIEDVMDNDEAMFYAGYLMQRHNNFEAAVNYFQRTINLSPEFRWAHYNMGFSLIRLGNSAAAVPYLEVEKERHPDDEDVALELGRALIGSDRVDEGIAEVQRAKDLAPDSEIIGSYYQTIRTKYSDHFESEG